jgi:hypothetical protein
MKHEKALRVGTAGRGSVMALSVTVSEAEEEESAGLF